MLKKYKVCVPAQSGNRWTKWEFVKRRDSSWNKTENSFWHKEFDIGLQIRCCGFALKDLQQITANII